MISEVRSHIENRLLTRAAPIGAARVRRRERSGWQAKAPAPQEVKPLRTKVGQTLSSVNPAISAISSQLLRSVLRGARECIDETVQLIHHALLLALRTALQIRQPAPRLPLHYLPHGLRQPYGSVPVHRAGSVADRQAARISDWPVHPRGGPRVAS